MFPSVTNVNNVSVCCGNWPDEHGITANSYYDRRNNCVEYMNSSEMIKSPTLFQKAASCGFENNTALFTCKRKTLELFNQNLSVAVVAEEAAPEMIKRHGPPGSIYSAEINHWLLRAAADALRQRTEIKVMYVHITDYPMHRWAPDEPESLAHLKGLDAAIEDIVAAAGPDALFLFTADHGMNAKKRCWDLAKVCAEQGWPVKFFLSPERDYYVPHHRNFTGCGWLYLNSLKDSDRVAEICLGLTGVEEVITGAEAARRYRLPLSHLGELVVLGDVDTMFGHMDSASEELTGYRAHGSLHEMDLPLLIYPFHSHLPRADFFRYNKDLTAFMH
jgi:phosphonoacetate hydrolase